MKDGRRMSETLAGAPRTRVRTPGKHIVIFLAAALLIIVSAMSMLRHVEQTPDFAFAGFGGEARGGAGEATALEPFLVDLAPDRQGRAAYLRLAASVKAEARARERIAAAEADIADRLNFLLRGLTPEDFAGEDGMTRVKAEMLRRVNLVIAPEKAQEIVITEIIIQ